MKKMKVRTYPCRVDRVVDGDTVDVSIDIGFSVWISQRLRIHAFDAPESRTRDKREKVHGLACKDRVKELVPEGSMQIITTVKSGRGKYGRVLSDFLNVEPDATLVDVLLRERHGVPYHGQKKSDIRAQHLENFDYRESLQA